MFGMYDPNKFHKMEGYYELGTNIINWFSVDEPQKLRGSKRDYLYCNEANELHIEDWNQLIFRTTDKVIVDLNPSELSCWVYDLEKRPDCYYFKTTYKDNPFIQQNIIDELESLKEKDNNLYRIYTLGERGFATTLVFNTWNTIERIPDGVKLLGYGVDFGYNDPSTVVGVYNDGDTLFFKELLYSRGLTTQDLITKMELLTIDKTDSFWCDSSQPQTIEELKRSRFNVKPVNKKSILHGIDLIKRHKVFITTDSTNTLQEFQSYKWKINKDGQMLDTPEDKDNHSIDSIRYVLESTIGNKKPKFTII
jgi:phage terminase large subunit